MSAANENCVTEARTLVWKQMVPHLFRGNVEFVVIGELEHLALGERSIASWLPVWPKVIQEQGDNLFDCDTEWSFYFDEVRAFKSSVETLLSGREDILETIQGLLLGAQGILATIHPLARNVAGRAIGFRLALNAARFSTGLAQPLSPETRVYWLTPPTEISNGEAVCRILQARYGIMATLAEPDWLQIYVLPDQAKALERVSEIKADIYAQQIRLADALNDAAKAGRFRKLLYASGTDLKESVEEALIILGARIKQDTQGKREPFFSVEKIGRCFYHVVARRLTLRQEEVQDFADKRGNPKGERLIPSLLFVNDHYDQSPENRPIAFTDTAIRTAMAEGICLLTTTQLYMALEEFQKNSNYKTFFWEAVTRTPGVCALPKE